MICDGNTDMLTLDAIMFRKHMSKRECLKLIHKHMDANAPDTCTVGILIDRKWSDTFISDLEYLEGLNGLRISVYEIDEIDEDSTITSFSTPELSDTIKIIAKLQEIGYQVESANCEEFVELLKPVTYDIWLRAYVSVHRDGEVLYTRRVYDKLVIDKQIKAFENAEEDEL